jgi:Thioredoxin
MTRPALAAMVIGFVGVLTLGPGSSARAQPLGSIALPPPRDTVQLYPGCNNIALSFPDGTTSQTVVQAVTPAGVVQAMWRHDAAQNRFEGFSPAAPQASDLLTVNLWDAVWLCVSVGPSPAPSVDDDPALGPENAPVTIIEFGDFQCPYCATFALETLPRLLDDYGDRVRFVFRDFPIVSIDPFALKAAEAAECADDQGAFWEYHDLLFQNQAALEDASLKNYAASLGLDTAAFNHCLDYDKYRGEVLEDLRDGEEAGVTGAPNFFINGVLIQGAQPYSVFQAAIEAALPSP